NIADPEQEFGSSIDFQTNKGNRYSVDGVIVSKDISKSGTGDLAWKLFDKVTNRTTEVQYVEWNTTRTGNVFPTIKIRSIELDGVVIKRVTGESADFIIDNQIGPGAIVEVIRANGVIPKIQKVIQSGKLFVPFECSCCGSNLEKIGAFLFCKNPKCELVLYKKLVNSLMQLKIDGLQEATIQILVKHFFGEEIPSIVEFVDVVLGESLVGIKGIGSKKSNQIKQNLSAIIHETDLVKIMISMGIPGLGRSISEVLLMKFQTIETIFKEKDNKESFTSIEMIGDKVYENLLIGLTESEKIFKELFQNSMNIPYGKSITEESKLKNFVLTGKFEKKRTEMAKLIEEKYGWKFSKSLNKKVDYLIVGSKPGSKVKKAKKMGIKIIEEAELI
ncbi:MAG: BRCT domain-containing protein, partial [Promethearchaeota archaeon]